MKNFLKVALILLLLTATLSSCVMIKVEKVEGGEVNSPDTTSDVETVETDEPDASDVDEEPLGFRTFLEGQQADIYDTVYENLSCGVNSFEVAFDAEHDDRFMLTTCIYIFFDDHPELFGYSYPSYEWTRGDGKITLTFDSSAPEDGADLESMRRETLDAANIIVRQAKDLDTDFDKILFVHDYLINHTTYDDSEEEYLYRNSAYACLVMGKCVCSGYAGAFDIIMKRLGINCLYIYGTADNGNDYDTHAWNLVESEGEWYMIDVTWDDCDMEIAPGNEAKYEYFCITTEEASEDHYSVGRYVEIPTCNSKDLNYYYHEGCYLNRYYFDLAEEIINNGARSIKFSNEHELNKAYKDLFENGRWQAIDALKDKTSIRYYKHKRILTIID